MNFIKDMLAKTNEWMGNGDAQETALQPETEKTADTPSAGKECYAVWVYESKLYRVCRDLEGLKQTIHEFTRCVHDECRGVLYVFRSDDPAVFPVATRHFPKQIKELFSFLYFKVNIQTAVFLDENGYGLPGYLMAWYRKDYSVFDPSFLHTVGLAPGGDGYTFTMRELECYFYDTTGELTHPAMFAFFRQIADPSLPVLDEIYAFLSENAHDNLTRAVEVVDSLAESPALKGLLGASSDLADRIQYLSGLELEEIDPFRNVYLFVHWWQLQERLSVLEEKKIEKGRFPVDLTLYIDRPMPLSRLYELDEINREWAEKTEWSRQLSAICERIEQSCKVVEMENLLDRCTRQLEALCEGNGSERIKQDLYVDCLWMADSLPLDFYQKMALLLVQSGLLAKDKAYGQKLGDTILRRWSDGTKGIEPGYFSLDRIRQRMPFLNPVTCLYVRMEKEAIVEQVNRQSRLVQELQSGQQEGQITGREDFLLEMKVEDAKRELDKLCEREKALYDLCEQLDREKVTDHTADPDVLDSLAASAGQAGYVPSEEERNVLSYYGLEAWIPVVFPAGQEEGTSIEFTRDETGPVEIFRERVELLSGMVRLYRDAGFRFIGWGFEPDDPYRASLDPSRYGMFKKQWPSDRGTQIIAHPLFRSDNEEPVFVNDYNFIRNMGPCSTDECCPPEERKRVLEQIRDKNLEGFEQLFDSRGTYKALQGDFLTDEGFEPLLVTYVDTCRALRSCTSIIQRDLLKRKQEETVQKLSARADEVWNRWDTPSIKR